MLCYAQGKVLNFLVPEHSTEVPGPVQLWFFTRLVCGLNAGTGRVTTLSWHSEFQCLFEG